MDIIKDEMDSMAINKVWYLVDLPPQCKSIGNKWVFKINIRQIDRLISARPV